MTDQRKSYEVTFNVVVEKKLGETDAKVIADLESALRVDFPHEIHRLRIEPFRPKVI